jgi:chromosomal replication initiator protein
LFVFGNVGQGKTHLMQAIGNRVLENNPSKNVLYVQSEKFANQAIEAFKNNSVQEFANYYLQVDVLILDDVQFLCGKSRTQELFFHIFNHLHQNGKQIVLSSDCAPNELNGLEERLISRFKWGLSAELTQPDFETRMAIIYKKLEEDGVVMPSEVIEYLAYSVETNVRELQGVVVSLIAQASLNKREIDLELAKQALHRIVKNIDVEVNIDYIMKFVSNYFSTSIEDMKGKTRKREIVVPRQVTMYLTKEYTNMSLKAIGYHFGNRDHSTVIHAIKTVNDMMDTDQKFYAMMQDILKKVKMKAS